MKWKFLNPDPKMINNLKEEFRSSEIIARVLANRNIESLDSSKPFFQPSLNELHDPFSMKDMEKAVNRIITNIESGKQIFIFGDYDVDGTTGAAMLYLTLTDMGGKVEPYIPNRETEGNQRLRKRRRPHGLGKEAEEGVKLFICRHRCVCHVGRAIQLGKKAFGAFSHYCPPPGPFQC